MSNKKAEFETLHILRQCRAEMVQDFLEHKPEIYKPSFKYENSPTLLKLAKEKYFTAWLSNHWQVFNSTVARFPIEEQQYFESYFARVFLELLGKWSIVKTTDSAQLNLGIKLIEEMEVALNQFMKVGENADMMRNKLEVALEKNKVLFDREFKRLSGE